MILEISHSDFRNQFSFYSHFYIMCEINYVATVACVEAMRHTEFVVEYFKLLKNGKPLKLKLNLFLETIVNPSKLTDREIEELMKVFSINFFKTNENLNLKQKITGFMIRMNCSDNFCEKVTNLPLSNYIISPSMSALNQLLIQFFKPVVLKVTTSKKSHCKLQMQAHKNITFEQFISIKSEKLEFNRKMSKFEVWTVKKEHEHFTYNIINHHLDDSQRVINNHHDTDNIKINTVFDDNGDNDDTMFDYDDLANFFSSFRG